nr:DUF2550 family protein [Angustibacter aerolatus]
MHDLLVPLEVVGALALLLVLAMAFVASRRRWLRHAPGTFDCSLRTTTESQARQGLAARRRPLRAGPHRLVPRVRRVAAPPSGAAAPDAHGAAAAAAVRARGLRGDARIGDPAMS